MTDEAREQITRFGIVCNIPRLQRWQAQCVDQLLSLPSVALHLIVLAHQEPTPRRSASSGDFLIRAFEQYVARPHACNASHLSVLDCRAPVFQCVLQRRGGSLILDEADVEVIRRQNLSFILYLGTERLGGALLHAARQGVWAFSHGSAHGRGYSTECFWEIYRDEPVCSVTLKQLTDDSEGDRVLRHGSFKCFSHSYAKSVNTVLFGASQLPAQVVQDLRNECAAAPHTAPVGGATVRSQPRLFEQVLFILKMGANSVRHVTQVLLREEHWNVGIAHVPITQFLDSATRPHVYWLSQPSGRRYHADPFALCRGGQLHVMFEEYPLGDKGIISSVAIEDGTIGEPKRVFEQATHMSYPFLFEYEDDAYCIPGTPQAGEVVLYRAVDFPYRWVRQAVLLDVPGIDNTVAYFEGRWWLFCTRKDAGADDRLFVYHASRLNGPWEPHRANPVKVDVRSSRPGGTPFVHEGVLYRPAQDSSRSYGGRLVINRVLALTPDVFREEAAAWVEPDPTGPYRHGLHTICGVGNLTVIDGKTYVYSRHVFTKHVERLLNRLRPAYSPAQGQLQAVRSRRGVFRA